MRHLLLLLLIFGAALPSLSWATAENIRHEIRGKPQSLHLLRPAGQAQPETVLFLPGDGGWLGKATDMARSMASLGYNVYVFDPRTYLMGFTGPGTLTESQMAADLRELCSWLSKRSGQPLILAGWSQGANMAVLGATAAKNDGTCRGVIAIGLSDTAVLGWRFVDNLTYITRQPPSEPTFSAVPLMKQLAPLPLAIIASTNDEYVKAATTQSLLQAAGEPKRLFRVEARNHRFDGNYAGFVDALSSSIAWIRTVSPQRVSP